MFTMKLEVVPIPVADVDRSIAFYRDQVGFNLDFDTTASDTVRFVQLTPHGSGCSIQFGIGLGDVSDMVPGSLKGLILVVNDVREVRDLLISRGVAVGEIISYPRDVHVAYFSDPDGNSWGLQDFPPDL